MTLLKKFGRRHCSRILEKSTQPSFNRAGRAAIPVVFSVSVSGSDPIGVSGELVAQNAGITIEK
jgi:hypothetical protein